MIVSDAGKAANLLKSLPSNHRPTMQAAMLISPEGFGINQESTTDNQYIQAQETVDLEVCSCAARLSRQNNSEAWITGDDVSWTTR